MEHGPRFDRISGAPAGVSRAPQAEECAAAVLDIVPAVMDALRAATRQHVGEQMSVPQFRCLHFVSRKPGCSISDVAAFLGVTLPTASAMVDRLVRAGALRTRPSRDDRRRTHLHLTPAGRARLRGIHQGAHADLSRALAQLSPNELRRLYEGLGALRRAFLSA
jgi:DNA-binding MarR family transcriptional regulator